MTGVTQPSYSHGASAMPLLGETIGANLRRVATTYPDREAVVDVPTGRRWTYAAFDAESDALARGLIAAGIEPGDRVGIWAPNCPEWVLLQYATAKAGIILVNINPAYRTHELAYALNQSGTKLLISASEFKTSNYRAMVDQVRDQVSVDVQGTAQRFREGAHAAPVDVVARTRGRERASAVTFTTLAIENFTWMPRRAVRDQR